MESQQTWARNRSLAEQFCIHDEQVRMAESVLQEAYASRNHLLAAFAVTVGRDRSVADLLGLGEREVRSARRSVGRARARHIAGQVLEDTQPVPEFRETEAGNAAGAGNGPGSGSGSGSGPEAHEREWSGDQDTALAMGWQRGVDLHVLSAQIGRDVTDVVARLKELSTQGMLRDAGAGEHPTRGRHRRQSADRTATVPDPIPVQPDSRTPPYPYPYQQAPEDHPTVGTGVWTTGDADFGGDSRFTDDGRTTILHGDVWSPPRYGYF